MSQAELARRLTQELSTNYERAAVYKMTAGRRRITANELVAIEKITGYPAPTLAKQPQEDALLSVFTAMIGAFQAFRNVSLEDAEQIALLVRQAAEEMPIDVDPEATKTARRVLAASLVQRFLKTKGIQ